MKIVVASLNPVKLKCTELAFRSVFTKEELFFEGVSVPSQVSDQPMTDEETLIGARNRAKNAQLEKPEADFWIGIEGGIDQPENGMQAFAWVSIISKDKIGEARTATFQLPPRIAELVNEGVELGIADDMVFNRENSKQGNGAVGILTHELIDRAAYYQPAVVLALIPFMNPDLY